MNKKQSYCNMIIIAISEKIKKNRSTKLDKKLLKELWKK